MGNKICTDKGGSEPLNANLSKGNQNYQLGNYEEAIVDYTKAIHEEPGNIIAYTNRAATYKALNNIP